MTKDREEIEKQLLQTKSVDEAKTLLAENGISLSDKEADEMYKKIEEQAPDFSKEVSLDELDAVSGGWFGFRNYKEKGCAATVELGSSCWGTDGDCAFVNVSYTHGPEKRCDKCGGTMINDRDMTGISGYILKCQKCGFEEKKYLSDF